MSQTAGKIVAIIGVTAVLVIFGLVLQFNAAANAVAVFQTEGIDSAASAAKVRRVFCETAGVSLVRIDPAKGYVIALFDARAVDPRTVAASVSSSGFPTQIRDLLTMREYDALVSGGSGCGTGNCGDCSKGK
ncbi:hypothetical protein OR1_03664 [Geobacter sp. OR-1]|uniref:hypothetical protein n=1 Tax=Geobacter sp. OR-1 TaxID=1266765 RepID=UPI000542663A|nr:hypothetical protein [Geobacter sp. OR-1]GAM11350.1 hypothetical protein OR1_03664 [Geobacter sp. OR-1]